ncbi:nSTAND1 domain-containing NTPase [Nostoc sp.]|uniref:nSTAND1 domain-containing NTPase n=1 Tax=Nostoc sp. TaxID=1180 RepID=UPI002FFD043F
MLENLDFSFSVLNKLKLCSTNIISGIGSCDPQGLNSDEREIGQAIQLCFRKVVLDNLGRKSSYAWLRKATVNGDGTVSYTDKEDIDTVKAAVTKAKNIVLYIHGIIGDTESMIPSVRHAKVNVKEQVKSVEELYDLVLAFDYESLNTPIEETAKILKNQLAAVGLTPNHGKTLHIVAHSMGGLVSRSFIEQGNGNEVVNHLIMVGTPNGGSPWATVHDLATTLLSFGLNFSYVLSFGLTFSYVPLVPSLVEKLVEAMSVTLREMHSTKSTFFSELKTSFSSRCPYSIIAGSTALINQASDGKQLLNALKNKLRRAIEFPFGDEENDIAVAVSSIIDVPQDGLSTVNILDTIACDHLSYFRQAEGLDAIASAISQAFGYPPEPLPPSRSSSPGLRPNLFSVSSGKTDTQPTDIASTNTSKVTQKLEQKENNNPSFPRSSVSPSKEQSVNQHSQKSVASLTKESKQKSQYDFKRSFAIIIGINYCDNKEVATLDNAVKDAKKIKDILENHPYNYRILSLLEKDATKTKLNKLLDFFKQGKVPLDIKYLEEGNKNNPNNKNDNQNCPTVTKDDRVLIYFAGHGKGKSIFDEADKPPGLLIPEDSKNDKESLRTDELYEALIKLECRHLLLILDCCYAGSFRWSIQKNRQVQDKIKPNKQLYDSYIKYDAWQVITSSSSDETALDSYGFSELAKRESTDQGHSPFAQFLFNALDPNELSKNFETKFITATEVYSFLRTKLNELVNRDEHKQQNPQIFLFPTKHDKGEYIFLELSQENRDKLEDAPALKPDNNPYLGIKSYEEKHSNLFFGREQLIEKLYKKVDNNPLTIVTGYSGIGKSSLVKAGLIPRYIKPFKEQLEFKNSDHQPREMIENLEKEYQIKFNESKKKAEEFSKVQQEVDKIKQKINNIEQEVDKVKQEVNSIKQETNNVQQENLEQELNDLSKKLEKLEKKLKNKLTAFRKQLDEDLKTAKKLCYIKLPIGSDPFDSLNEELKKICIFATPVPKLNKTPENKLNLINGLLDTFLNLFMRKSERSNSNVNEEDELTKNMQKWKEDFDSKIFGDKRILIIDQFEEIIKLAEDKRNKFLDRLVELVNQHREWLRIVLTMPSDIKHAFHNNLIYEYLTDENQFLVEEMTREQLREAIEKPAQIRTMFFEYQPDGQDLVNQLLDDVGQTPRLLPLVSYTLEELYKKRIEQFKKNTRNIDNPDDRKFTLKDYQDLGGVKKSLVNRINSVYEELIEYKEFNSIYQAWINELFLFFLLCRQELVLDLVFIICNWQICFFDLVVKSDYPSLMRYVFFELGYSKESEEHIVTREDILSIILDLEDNEQIVDLKIYMYVIKTVCLPQLEKNVNNIKIAKKNSITWDKTIKNVMLRMVEVRPPSEITRRRVYISKLNYPDNTENKRVEKILEKFEESNLLIKPYSQDEVTSSYVELANDIVVKEWEELQICIASEEEKLKNLRREIESAADSWNNNEKNEDLLWHNNAFYLKQLEEIYESENNWLNQLEKDFVKASFKKQKEIEDEKTRLRNKLGELQNEIINKSLDYKITIETSQQDIKRLNKELEESNLSNISEVIKYQEKLKELENELEELNVSNTNEVTKYQEKLKELEESNLSNVKEKLKEPENELEESNLSDTKEKLKGLENELEESNVSNTNEVTKYQEKLKELENELKKIEADKSTKELKSLKKRYIISSAIISSAITMTTLWGCSRIFPNFQGIFNYISFTSLKKGTKVKPKPPIPEITIPEINRADISEGKQIITNTDPLAWVKLAGVQAFNDNKIEKAVTDLTKYLNKRPNDPEALIYLNNYKITKLKKKFYTIAVSAPIASDINSALEMLRGVAQAQDEINKKGGINGILLQVLIADDNDDKDIAEKLVKNSHVLGVVGHFSSDVTLETEKIYNAGKLVAIFPISTSTKLPDFGNYIFRTAPNDSEVAKSLVGHMRSNLGKNAAVFYNSKSASSKSLKLEFEKFLSKEGGQVSSVFDLSDANFNADNSTEQSIKSGAEVLVLLPNTGKLDDTLQVVKANNKRLPLLGGDDVYTPKVLEEGANEAVSMVVAVPWHILASKTDFPKTSYDLWGASVNWRTAMSYNATVALIEGLKNISTPPTRERLAQILRSPDFTAMGATGEVKFDAKGDRNQGIQLVKIQANPKSRSKSGYDFCPVPSSFSHATFC